MSRASRRRQNIEKIRSLAAGNAGKLHDGEIRSIYQQGDEPEDNNLETFKKLGGKVVLFQHDPNSLPIGTDPETQPGFVERMMTAAKEVVDKISDIFHNEQQPVTVREKIAVRRQFKNNQENKIQMITGISHVSYEDLKEKFVTQHTGDLEQLINIYIR